ncbi:MAG TPA: site-specific integrase [Gammaproteobacteria bacterium]|nr:site-specific integrase [Gammaproteobacteria bacterium]
MVEGFIGSQAIPELSGFRQRVGALYTKAQEFLCQADKDFEQAHNLYAVYTAMLLMHGTGHRPVLDPFCYPIGDDDDCAVIEDKVMTTQHAQRLVVLPRIAKTQVQNYRVHLAALAKRLRMNPGGKPLARSIEYLLRPTQRLPPIPFLFLLRNGGTVSLAPSSMRQFLADWPYPLNLGRHFIGTGLLRAGLRAECITFQLGHLVPEASAAGPESLWSPASLVAVLQPALDKLMAEQGWQALPGFRVKAFARSRMLTPDLRPHYHHGRLGPDIRRQAREADEQRDRETVHGLIVASIPEGSKLDQTKLNELTQTLKAFAGGDSRGVARQIQILRSWVHAYPHRDPALRLPPREYLLVAEPARFDWTYPSRLAIARNVAERFKRYLRDACRSGKEVEPALRRAELLVSAALFGGLVDATRLRTLANAGPGVAGIFNDLCLCNAEPDSRNSEAQRWLPDDLTAALLTGGAKHRSCDAKDVKSGLQLLLRQLAPGVHIHEPFDTLAGWAQAYWQHQLPGALAPVLNGTLPSEPLPLPTLARLLRAVRLDAKANSEAEPILSALPPVCIGRPKPEDKDRETYSAIQKVFRAVEASEARGTERYGRQQRQALLEGLKAITQDTSHAPSPVVAALLAWAMQLCIHGTRWRSRLKFNTIRRYVYALGRALIECTGDINFLILSDSEFEAIYRNVLKEKAGKNIAYTGARLLEFHAFLVHTWGVEVPDWSFLPPDAWRRAHTVRADANVFAPHEYRLALKLLCTDDAVDERTRLYQAALLILGYRFGLRIGEALRTRHDDLYMDREHGLVVINVEANIYGGLKSDAAARQVPLIGPMDDVEWEILEKLRAAFEVRLQPTDPIASLFANPAEPRAPIERRLLMDRIHTAMRLVSGDESLHYHHLRHTFASKLLMGVMADFGDSKAWTAALEALWGSRPDSAGLRTFLTGHPEPFNVSLEAVSTLMGHASISVTLGSYVHFVPELVHGIGAVSLPHFPDQCWAYALQQPRDTVRKRLARASAQESRSTPLPRKWPPIIQRLTVPVSHEPMPDALPRIERTAKALDLESVDWILQTVSQKGGLTQGVADCLLVSEATVFELVDRARKVQRSSGYRRFNLTPPSNQWTSSTSDILVAPLLPHKESRRVREGLKTWQRMIPELDVHSKKILAEGLRIWSSLPEGSADRFLLPDREAFNRFVDALLTLGVPRHKLRARHLRTNRSADLSESLSSMGFHVMSERRSAREAVSLSLVPGTLPWSYTSSLARGLFVLAVDRS